MKPLTNETLIEEKIRALVKELFYLAHVDYDENMAEANMTPPDEEGVRIIKGFLDSALQAKEGEMKEKIKSKKKYWHIRFEGISDPVISAERKKFNEEVSELINSVLDDLLSNLSK